jgi:chitin synthase
VSTGKGTVEVVLPTAQADIDLEYDKSLHNLRTRPMIIRGEAAREEKDAMRQDWFRDIRTNVLLLWVLSNAILAAFILGGDNVGTFDPGSGTTRSKVSSADVQCGAQAWQLTPCSSQVYMLVILVFIGAMSCVRFGMSTLFMIHRLFVG